MTLQVCASFCELLQPFASYFILFYMRGRLKSCFVLFVQIQTLSVDVVTYADLCDGVFLCDAMMQM